MSDTLPDYNAALWAAGGRAAEAAAPLAKAGADRLARLRNVLESLDHASARVLRSLDPSTDAQAQARALWSLRHEGIPGALDLADALTAAAQDYIKILDALLGDYWPTNPATGDPLVPGYTRLAPQAPPDND